MPRPNPKISHFSPNFIFPDRQTNTLTLFNSNQHIQITLTRWPISCNLNAYRVRPLSSYQTYGTRALTLAGNSSNLDAYHFLVA